MHALLCSVHISMFALQMVKKMKIHPTKSSNSNDLHFASNIQSHQLYNNYNVLSNRFKRETVLVLSLSTTRKLKCIIPDTGKYRIVPSTVLKLKIHEYYQS